MDEEYIIPLLERDKFYDFIERSQCVCGGHLVFHDLHHEFYLNPSLLFQPGKEQFANVIGAGLAKAIGESVDFLLTPEPKYSEAAEFGSDLSGYFSPRPEIITLQYRKVPPNSNTATPYVIPDPIYPQLEGKSVLFIDSGTVTGESVVSIRDGLIRARSGPIHIFTFFHRKDSHWAKNLTGMSARGITVKYYYLGQLFIPVWRARDCPWELEEDYWRGRRQKFHSKRAQIVIGEHFLALQPVQTHSIDWATDTASKNKSAEQAAVQLQFSAFSPPGVFRNSETFLKFRLVNEYLESQSLNKTILGGISSQVAKTLKGSLAILAVTESARSHKDKNVISDPAKQRIIAACRVVLFAKDTTPRDKWLALGVMRAFLGAAFVDELPELLHRAQFDASMYLGLVDNIHKFIEELPDSIELVRQAFDVARHSLDREFKVPTPSWLENDEFRRRATVLYDLRQDQYSLLPVGRTEYPLSQILLPLHEYIAEDKPQHIPVAKHISNILKILSEDEVYFEDTKAKTMNGKTVLPVRLRFYLERWRDDVYNPLQTIYTLLKGLFEFPFLAIPSYLSEASPANMFSDINISNTSVERLHNWEPNWEPKKSRDELDRLRESLSRLFENTFEEQSIVWDQVRAWFVNLRQDIGRYHTMYEGQLRERGIELNIDWGTRSKTAIWYRQHFQHAFNNFFDDALKDEEGPFPGKYEGEKRISIVVTTHQEQGNIQIIWEDTGVGITEEQIQAMEDLGGDGTLGKIRRRLRRVGGDLRAERRPGGGTQFIIDLIGADL